MKDNDIIKALEICFKTGTENYLCDKCPYYEKRCSKILIKDVLELINRQKAEIEKLNKQVFCVPARANGKSMLVRMTLKSVADEAIKKFAEKLKEGFARLEHRPEMHRKTIEVERFINIVNWVLHEVTTKEIDRVVKEMVGESND